MVDVWSKLYSNWTWCFCKSVYKIQLEYIRRNFNRQKIFFRLARIARSCSEQKVWFSTPRKKENLEYTMNLYLNTNKYTDLFLPIRMDFILSIIIHKQRLWMHLYSSHFVIIHIQNVCRTLSFHLWTFFYLMRRWAITDLLFS